MRRSVVLTLGLMVAGCSSAGDGVFLFNDTGKYEYYNCEQLAAARRTSTARERELKELIEKAEQGAGGVIVGAIAYQADYRTAQEDLRIIDAAERAKSCAVPPTWRSNSVIR